MIVEATAPTRIDLAGGTLDIYPLYLFEEGGLTVNLAIELRSRARVAARADGRVRIASVDGGVEEQAESAAALAFGGPLDLCARIVRFYHRGAGGLEVEVESRAPRGSGLGASSSLLISLSAALNAFHGHGHPLEQLIDWGANLEAQNIGIPTGKQDYYAAAFGGASALWFDAAGGQREALLLEEEALAVLESRLLLSFTGISHFSGATNWDMLRNYIEDTGDTRARLRAIKRTAEAMRAALRQGDLDAFAAVLGEEWQNRRGLAQGVSTPEIDRMIAAAAAAGALASKLCGAGGGGCMVTFCREGKQEAVRAALAAKGAQLLEYRIARSGVEVGEIAG